MCHLSKSVVQRWGHTIGLEESGSQLIIMWIIGSEHILMRIFIIQLPRNVECQSCVCFLSFVFLDSDEVLNHCSVNHLPNTCSRILHLAEKK